jgi:hypothetical protein
MTLGNRPDTAEHARRDHPIPRIRRPRRRDRFRRRGTPHRAIALATKHAELNTVLAAIRALPALA